jgi:RNA polymerase sigma-70 factor, ECF subfamily
MQTDSPPAAGTELANAELVRRFQDGDVEAFVRLVRQWERSVLWIAYRVLGDLAEAEDVRQSVFLKLYQAPDAISDPAAFPAWIRRATANTAVSAARRRSRGRAALPLIAQARPGEIDTQPADAPEAQDEARRLTAALEQIDPDDRALLSLRFDEDLTFDQLAAVFGRPASTLKSRYQAVIGQLRRLLTRESNLSRIEHKPYDGGETL